MGGRGKGAVLLALLSLGALAAEPPAPLKEIKEAARREKFFSAAKSPLSREDVTGWLFGGYLRWDPEKREYRQEHMILVGEGGRLVPFSWPMGENRKDRLEEVRAELPARRKRYAAPVFSPLEISFKGTDGSRWRLRKFGEDLFLKVEREGSEPGYAVLTEMMAPPRRR